MPFHLGMPELILFASIALLLFGKRVPELARGLGQGIKEFKRGLQNGADVDTAA